MSTRSLRLAIVALACVAVCLAIGPAADGHAAPASQPRTSAASGDHDLLAQRSRPRAPRTKKKRGKTTEATPATAEPTDGVEGGDGKPGAASKPGAEPTDSTGEPAAEGAGASTGAAGPASAAPATPSAPDTTESTTPEVASSAELVDVDALRQEYLQLRDELFRSRARASTISSQLYSTKVTIRFAFASGRHYGVNKASIRLDGASVFDDSEGAVAGDDAVRFEGYVAPGRHVLTFRIEVTGKDDDRFTSAHEAQVALQAVAGKDLLIIAKAKDGGDIAYAWKRGEKGSYGLGLDISVKAQKRAAPKTSSVARPRPAVAVASAAGARP